jgi:dienelactone hydrolase
MSHQPRLIPVSVPSEPEAAVVVCHGGASRRADPMVSPTQLSVLRMVPVARRVARVGGDRVAVFRLLNSTRGWDTRHTPVDDVDWALDQVARQCSDLPVGLVGHSLGGRAVLLAGDHPTVRSVVALNAFVFPSDAPRLQHRRVLFVHGEADRIAVPQRAEAVARRVMATTDAAFVTVEGGKHAMLRRGRTFEQLAAEATVAATTSVEPSRRWSPAIRAVLAGERHVTT